MNHATIEQLVRELVLPFYEIKRDIRLPIGRRAWENDAEHSWSVAFLACALAAHIDPTLDVGKIAQYAIVHDIVEVHAGDTSTFAPQAEHDTKQAREAAALERIRLAFPQFSWIIETLEAYERKEDDESKFVYAFDKYITIIYDYIDEARLFYGRKVSLEQYNQSLIAHRKKVQLYPKIAVFYEEVRALLDAHPEFFYSEET